MRIDVGRTLTQTEVHAVGMGARNYPGSILDLYVRDDLQNTAENENPVRYPLPGFFVGAVKGGGCVGTLSAYFAHDLEDATEPKIYALVNEYVLNGMSGSLVGNAAYRHRHGSHSHKFMISCPPPSDYKDTQEEIADRMQEARDNIWLSTDYAVNTTSRTWRALRSAF